MERYEQSETYYPQYQEGTAGNATGVDFSVIRLADGFWWDFTAGAFQDAYDADSLKAMTEDDAGGAGLWNYQTGWAIPDANAQYRVRFKVTDPTGSFYRMGPKLVVNSAVFTTVAGFIDLIRAEAITDGETSETIGGMLLAIYCEVMQKKEVTASSIKTYKLDDTTTLRTQTLTDDDTTVTRGGG